MGISPFPRSSVCHCYRRLRQPQIYEASLFLNRRHHRLQLENTNDHLPLPFSSDAGLLINGNKLNSSEVLFRLISNTFAHQIGSITVIERKRLGVCNIPSHLPVHQLTNRHRLIQCHKPNQFHAAIPNLTTSSSKYAMKRLSAMQMMAASHDPWPHQP